MNRATYLGKRRISVDVPTEIHRKLRIKAATEDVTMAEIIIAALVEALEQGKEVGE